MKTLRPLLSLTLLASVASSMFASAGRIAVGPNTTPGSEYYSYLIDEPGSYYVPPGLSYAAGKNGIGIRAGGVTLDLNGSTLTGDGTSPANGIQIVLTDGPVRVYNGTVRNWRDYGIYVYTSDVSLADISSVDNGRAGFRLTENAAGTIERCIAEHNAGAGFLVGYTDEAMIIDCMARYNGERGFSIVNGFLRGCHASRNGDDGIQLTEGSLLDCISRGNSGDGLRVGTANVQRCTVMNNYNNGIVAYRDSILAGNLISGHVGGTGGTDCGILILQSGNRIEDNTLTGNAYGIKIFGTANFIARNAARSTSRNYWIINGNRVGSISVPPLSGLVNGNSGAAGSGATDPWGNIAY